METATRWYHERKRHALHRLPLPLLIGQGRFPVAGCSFLVAVAKRRGDAGASFG